MSDSTLKSIDSFDLGSSSTSCEPIKLSPIKRTVGILIKTNTGDITGGSLGLEFSNNGTDWYLSTVTSGVISRDGNFSLIVEYVPFDYVRVCVLTKSTVASNVKLIIQVK